MEKANINCLSNAELEPIENKHMECTAKLARPVVHREFIAERALLTALQHAYTLCLDGIFRNKHIRNERYQKQISTERP